MLARIIGHEPSARPYRNQKPIPVVNTMYIASEMPLVSRLRMVLIACGTNASVVRIAAA